MDSEGASFRIRFNFSASFSFFPVFLCVESTSSPDTFFSFRRKSERAHFFPSLYFSLAAMVMPPRAASARPVVDALRERRRGWTGREQRQIDGHRRLSSSSLTNLSLLRPRPPLLDLLDLSRRRGPPTAAATAPSASEPSPPSSRNFTVREATEEDWWHLSQVHCAAFFPSTPSLLVPLLRLDRVLGLEAGAGNEAKGRGRFTCLVAVQEVRGGEEERRRKESDDNSNEEGEEERVSFPLSLLPRQLHGCFESLEKGATRAGVLGAVCLDAQGCSLPLRRLPLARRNAAVASFVSLVSPNSTTKEPSVASSPPPSSSPPQGLRAPPGTVAYLSNLAVSPHARQLGVGRALMEAAEKEAWGWGCRSVALHVSGANAAASALYLSSGFRAVGGALPLVVGEEPRKEKGEKTRTTQQQLTGGPLTLMLKVAPREVVARRAREKNSSASSPVELN